MDNKNLRISVLTVLNNELHDVKVFFEDKLTPLVLTIWQNVFIVGRKRIQEIDNSVWFCRLSQSSLP